MATGDNIQGDARLIHIWDGAAYRPVACLTSVELSSTSEVKERQTMCQPGVVSSSYGSVNKTLSVEGEFIDTTSTGGDTAKASFDYLEGKQDAKEKVIVKMDQGLETPEPKYARAIISDLALTGPAGEISTFTATFNLDGGYIADPNA